MATPIPLLLDLGPQPNFGHQQQIMAGEFALAPNLAMNIYQFMQHLQQQLAALHDRLVAINGRLDVIIDRLDNLHTKYGWVHFFY